MILDDQQQEDMLIGAQSVSTGSLVPTIQQPGGQSYAAAQQPGAQLNDQQLTQQPGTAQQPGAAGFNDTALNDIAFMRLAIEQAHLAEALGEVPIGAVVAYGGQLVAAAHNRREIDADPSAHAEFAALLAAARRLGRWRLSGCTVYVTLEPCLMCAGLMQQSRIDRCVYGAADPKAGALGTLYAVHADSRLNHRFEAVGGVCQQECASLLSNFFARLRTKEGSGR
jgi:tRNA(adenine34) deaminase